MLRTACSRLYFRAWHSARHTEASQQVAVRGGHQSQAQKRPPSSPSVAVRALASTSSPGCPISEGAAQYHLKNSPTPGGNTFQRCFLSEGSKKRPGRTLLYTSLKNKRGLQMPASTRKILYFETLGSQTKLFTTCLIRRKFFSPDK